MTNQNNTILLIDHLKKLNHEIASCTVNFLFDIENPTMKGTIHKTSMPIGTAIRFLEEMPVVLDNYGIHLTYYERHRECDIRVIDKG